MSFDNHHYPNRKDHREPYRGSKGFDRSCRNHGGCPYCEGGRTVWRKRLRTAEKLEWEYFESYCRETGALDEIVPGRTLGPMGEECRA